MTQPWFAAGNAIGCLVVHGFSGHAQELQPLAEALAAEGYTVSLPLLPGHGNRNMDLGTVQWRDWVAAVHAAADELRQRCTTIVLVGYSMGGALMLLEATTSPADLLVLLAPALGITLKRSMQFQMRLLPALKYARPWFYPLAQANFSDPQVRAKVHSVAPEVDLDDPAVQKVIRHQVRLPMRAIDQFYRVALRANRLGAAIKQPTLIIHGRNDQTIPLMFSQMLYQRLGSPDKKLHVWENVGHALINGLYGEAITALIVQWVCERVAQIVPDGAAECAHSGVPSGSRSEYNPAHAN